VIIDAHCHVWPDDIARQVLATRPVGLTPVGDGTIEGLLRTMDDAGVDRGCCLGVATIAKNVEKTNAFIGAVDRSRFFAFGTIHPDLSVEENMRSLTENGIQGVKVHPIFQGIALSDPRVREILVAVAEANIVVITHAGDGGDDEGNRRGAPQEVLALALAIPSLKLIACHYGGYHRFEEATSCLVGSNIVLETSWPPSLDELDAAKVRAAIEQHGAQRFVFGSDWPMADPAREIAALRGLGLSSADEDALLGGTLERLLSSQHNEGTYE
jgi:uncharacterized protein